MSRSRFTISPSVYSTSREPSGRRSSVVSKPSELENIAPLVIAAARKLAPLLT
jgi:hypothetical protein